MRVEIREAAPTLRGNERLVLLGLHGAEIVFCSWINGACLRMVDAEVQTEPVPNLERIAPEQVEPRPLLFEVEPVLKTESLRQLARIDSEVLACLIVAVARVEHRKSRRQWAIEQIRFGKTELILRLPRSAL